MATKEIKKLIPIVGLIMQRENGDIYYRLLESNSNADPLWLKFESDGNTLTGQTNPNALDAEMLPLVRDIAAQKLAAAMGTFNEAEQVEMKEALAALSKGKSHGN